MTNPAQWKSDQVLAWTERDGPGRPPAGPGRGGYVTLAVAFSAVLYGMMSWDTLCPEHRAWVTNFAFGALVTGIAAVVGLVRRRPSSAVLALAAALAGVAVGLLDAAHSALRGGLLATAFCVLAAGAFVVLVRQGQLTGFDRQVLASAAPLTSRPAGAAEPAVVEAADHEATVELVPAQPETGATEPVP